jgi:uncharacterized membrane-anchored protein
MTRVTRWFWIVVLAQAAVLLAWAGWHEQVRSTAKVIRLKTAPVDPQDLLRGDFMILNYEISAVTPPEHTYNLAGKGTEFWVVLEPRDGFYAAVRAQWKKPELAAGQIAVLGRLGAFRGVAYGIETYFVPQGKGTPRFKTIEVEASVSPNHRLYLKRVLIDGRPYP